MGQVLVEDRRATRDEVAAHFEALVRLGAGLGLSRLRVREDGAVALTVAGPGYWSVAQFIDQATELVGAYVYVVTDGMTVSAAE